MKNKLLAKFINQISLQLLRLSAGRYKPLSKKQDLPLLVSGIFRSGTSITSRILLHVGFDPGPEKHLIPAKGKYSGMNPDGYFENFFFMELSMYLFQLTNSFGDNPPDENIVEQLQLNNLSDDDLRKQSLLVTRDSRMSNLKKIASLRKVSVHAIPDYLSNEFGERPLIKNPHFSVLEPFFKKIFPGSKRVVVFRNPEDWKRSAFPVSEKSDYALYDKYYSNYLASTEPGIIFFDYDQLLREPGKSIRALLDELKVNFPDVNPLADLVRRKENYSAFTGDHPVTYKKMKERAVNQ